MRVRKRTIVATMPASNPPYMSESQSFWCAKRWRIALRSEMLRSSRIAS
jgi:hypothetical protein